MRFILGLTLMLAAVGCARNSSVKKDPAANRGPANELRYARDTGSVRKATAQALEGLLRESDPPTVLRIREDGGQLSTPWYYGTSKDGTLWRRKTSVNFLPDGDDTIAITQTELQFRTPDGWSPESESVDAYRGLGARIRDHLP